MILGQGLAYDRCQIGVVTRMDPARHFGPYHIETAEQVFQVFRCQVDVVLPAGVAVLNAADPGVTELAALCDGEVIFFAIDPALAVITEHRARGGRAVFARGEELVLAEAADESPLMPLAAIPFLAGSQAGERLASVLAAISVAWALGIALHVIRTGAETFCHDPERAGGPAKPHSILINA